MFSVLPAPVVRTVSDVTPPAIAEEEGHVLDGNREDETTNCFFKTIFGLIGGYQRYIDEQLNEAFGNLADRPQ